MFTDGRACFFIEKSIKYAHSIIHDDSKNTSLGQNKIIEGTEKIFISGTYYDRS
jgi:hypothetical protein